MLLDKAGVGQVDAEAGLVLVTGVEVVGAPHPEKERLLLVGLVERGGCKRNQREHSLRLLSFGFVKRFLRTFPVSHVFALWRWRHCRWVACVSSVREKTVP